MPPGKMASPMSLSGSDHNYSHRPSNSGHGRMSMAARNQERDPGNWTVTSSMTPARKKRGPSKRGNPKRLVAGFPEDRRPRTLTEVRKKKILAFNDMLCADPEKFSVEKMGLDEWIEGLIKFMKERKNHALTPADVKYWMRTNVEFFNKEYVRMPLNHSSIRTSSESVEPSSSSSSQPTSYTSTISSDSGVYVESGAGNGGGTESDNPPGATTTADVAANDEVLDENWTFEVPGAVWMMLDDGGGGRTVHSMSTVRDESTGEEVVTFGPPTTLDDIQRRSTAARLAILERGPSIPKTNDERVGLSMPDLNEEPAGMSMLQIKDEPIDPDDDQIMGGGTTLSEIKEEPVDPYFDTFQPGGSGMPPLFVKIKDEPGTTTTKWHEMALAHVAPGCNQEGDLDHSDLTVGGSDDKQIELTPEYLVVPGSSKVPDEAEATLPSSSSKVTDPSSSTVRSDLANPPVDIIDVVQSIDCFGDMNSLMTHLVETKKFSHSLENMQLFASLLDKMIEGAREEGAYPQVNLDACYHATQSLTCNLGWSPKYLGN